MREITYTEYDCNAETEPIIPIRHQLIETQLQAAPPLVDFDGGETQPIAPVDEKRIAILAEQDEFDMVSHRIWRRIQGLIRRDNWQAPCWLGLRETAREMRDDSR